MVLFEVDPDRVLAIPFERHAPWSVDVNGETGGLTVKPVKIEAGNIQVLGLRGSVQGIETQLDAREQIRPNTGGAPSMPQCRQSTMSERTGHCPNRKPYHDTASIEA
jgi:hypothetical protein